MNRLSKVAIAGWMTYHLYHHSLPIAKKHTLVLDIDDTTGKSLFNDPKHRQFPDKIAEFGTEYTHMHFEDYDEKTKSVEVEDFFFFPRRHLWMVGLLQKMGYINVCIFSDASGDYVEKVASLYQTLGVTQTFTPLARENNPDFAGSKKKNLNVLRSYVHQNHGIELKGSMILVDDKASKRVDGQDFYLIPKIDNNKNDNELLKMLAIVYMRCVSLDIQNAFSYVTRCISQK